MMLTGRTRVGAAAVTVRSQPYPWPYHGRLEPEHTALLVVTGPVWPGPGTPEAGSPAAQVRLLARRMVALGGAVVYVISGPPSEALPGPPYHYVQCTGSSAFYGSPLDALLRRLGRTDLVLCGWGLEGPVHSSMRSANDRGYECLLVPDASVAADPALAEPACEMVRMSGGIFGAFASTAEVVATLDTLALLPGGPAGQLVQGATT